MVNIDSKIVIEGSRLFEEFKGALTENYILNMLNVVYEDVPYYFIFDRHEIDFIIQTKNKIIPIEVKSGESTKNKSLCKYNNENDTEISIRASLKNLSKDGKILNIPLFLIEYIDDLIDIV